MLQTSVQLGGDGALFLERRQGFPGFRARGLIHLVPFLAELGLLPVDAGVKVIEGFLGLLDRFIPLIGRIAAYGMKRLRRLLFELFGRLLFRRSLGRGANRPQGKEEHRDQH